MHLSRMQTGSWVGGDPSVDCAKRECGTRSRPWVWRLGGLWKTPGPASGCLQLPARLHWPAVGGPQAARILPPVWEPWLQPCLFSTALAIAGPGEVNQYRALALRQIIKKKKKNMEQR